MANYQLTEATVTDLERIYYYGIVTFGLFQADKYYGGLISQLQKIAENPDSYTSVDDIFPGYRRATYYSNSVYYRSEHDQVIIVRILGRENPVTAFEVS